MVTLSADSIEELRQGAMEPRFLAHCAEQLKRPEPEIRHRVTTAWSEALVGLDLLREVDLSDRRVLEIGAGIGFVSILMQGNGFNLTAIEPGSGGFDMNARIGACLILRKGSGFPRRQDAVQERVWPLPVPSFMSLTILPTGSFLRLLE